MPRVRTRAWLMDVGGGRRVAAGTHHVVEYLRSPETIGLPLAPAHCPALLIWRAQIVPSVDLARLLPGRETARRTWPGAVILAYQEAPGKPLRYGALLVYAAPQEIWVSNDMTCPLPEESAAFKYFTCACFAHQEHATPILAATQLFSESPPWTPSPQEDEAEDAVNPLETMPAAPAASDTPKPFTEALQVLEQETPHTEALPETTEHQWTSVEETAPVESSTDASWAVKPSTDASRRESDLSSDPVAPASEARPHVRLQMPPAPLPAAAGSHTVANPELTAEEKRALRRRQAQQIIGETLAAIHNEVCLTRVLFAVLTRDGRSVRAQYYRGVDADSPLRRFCFEREDSSLFARLVERPQHVWLHAGNRNRLVHLLSAEMRESLGESELFASSIFLRWRFVGVCYGDEFPSTEGLDERRYEKFKSLCNGMVRRLCEIAT